MADRNESTQELLLDIRVAEASKLYKFYLSQEKKILGAAGVTIFLIIWELVGNVLQLINPMFMSAPSLIAKAAIDLFSSGEIYNDLYISGTELLWGYLLSAAVAIPFGIMVGWYKKMSYIFDPFINAMNATPSRGTAAVGYHLVGNRNSLEGRYYLSRRSLPDIDQFARRRENHAGKSSHCCQELRCFGMDDLQSCRPSFYYPLHSEWFEARTWQGYRGCYGRRALCGHRRNRFHDHSGGCHLPNR